MPKRPARPVASLRSTVLWLQVVRLGHCIANRAPVLIVLLACGLGFVHYRAAPAGHLLYTPLAGTCPSYSHSFTTGDIFVLFVGAVVWIVSCIAWGVARSLAGRAPSGTRWWTPVRRLLTGVALIGVCGLAHPLIERVLPLQAPPCTPSGPEPGLPGDWVRSGGIVPADSAGYQAA